MLDALRQGAGFVFASGCAQHVYQHGRCVRSVVVDAFARPRLGLIVTAEFGQYLTRGGGGAWQRSFLNGDRDANAPQAETAAPRQSRAATARLLRE